VNNAIKRKIFHQANSRVFRRLYVQYNLKNILKTQNIFVYVIVAAKTSKCGGKPKIILSQGTFSSATPATRRLHRSRTIAQ